MEGVVKLWKDVERETISVVCGKIMPVPAQGVLIGVGTDELPVLIDVADRNPKNILVWDRIVGQGLGLIKTAVEFILRYKDQSQYRTEFVIVSNNNTEWEALNEYNMGVGSPNECIAVLPFYDTVLDKVLDGLAAWVTQPVSATYPVILFLDGLENLSQVSEESVGYLRWILSRGYSKHIFVIGTAKGDSRELVEGWLAAFSHEMFGEDNGFISMVETDEDDKEVEVFFWTPITTI